MCHGVILHQIMMKIEMGFLLNKDQMTFFYQISDSKFGVF